MNQEERWLLEEKYEGVESKAFHADLKRLHAGEPLAYIIGSIPFLGCTIYLDSHPLIPRVETEFWVEKAIADIKSAASQVPRVLDLCSGSGCIGIAVLTHVPHATVDFSDLTAEHNTTVNRSIAANNIDSLRTNCITGDLFEHITGTYDFILSNPPYIDPALDRTEQSVQKFEPAVALYGGAKGCSLLQKIIADAPQRLTSNGILYLEHEPEQVSALQECAQLSGFVITIHKDQYGVPRYSRLSMAQ